MNLDPRTWKVFQKADPTPAPADPAPATVDMGELTPEPTPAPAEPTIPTKAVDVIYQTLGMPDLNDAISQAREFAARNRQRATTLTSEADSIVSAADSERAKTIATADAKYEEDLKPAHTKEAEAYRLETEAGNLEMAIASVQ